MVDGMARDLTRTAVLNRSVGQVLQSCLADKWDQLFPAVPREEVQDVPLGCRITTAGVIRNCVLGLGRCHLRSATHPVKAWSVPSSCTECKSSSVNGVHSLSSTSGISSNIWPMLMWWPARFPSYLAHFSLSLYSVADRGWPLSPSLWNLPLWPSIGRSFQGLHSCTLFITFLHLDIKISLLSPFLLVVLISWSLLCAGLYFLASTSMIPRKSLLFIIVLLWKLAVKVDTLQYLQRHGK